MWRISFVRPGHRRQRKFRCGGFRSSRARLLINCCSECSACGIRWNFNLSGADQPGWIVVLPSMMSPVLACSSEWDRSPFTTIVTPAAAWCLVCGPLERRLELTSGKLSMPGRPGHSAGAARQRSQGLLVIRKSLWLVCFWWVLADIAERRGSYKR